MSQSLKSLPIGIYKWQDICEYNMFFVDKTARLGTLVTNQRKIFLSRPRRMGKSTLVSQLEDLFTNGVKNFENTAICDKWPYQDTCPVINLSFINVKGDTIDEVVVSLQRNLEQAYHKAGFDSVVASDKPDLEKFLYSLARISWQHQLVFLIDEWDYLLSNNLHDQVFCDELLSQFRKFYDWLRMLDNVRFILVTGIMRYHSASLFTGQDIIDISMDPRWADLLGITHDELVTCYAPYIKVAAERLGWSEEHLIAELKEHYDGFCFDRALSAKLYSPYALNRFFAPIVDSNDSESSARIKPEFLPYWMNSSNAAAALRSYLLTKPFDLPNDFIELKSLVDFGIEISDVDLTQPVDLSNVTIRSILTQAGYLTLKGKKVVPVKNSVKLRRDALEDLTAADDTELVYICGVPNRDVASEFTKVVKHFIDAYINIDKKTDIICDELYDSLERDDIARACNSFNELIEGIRFDVFKDAHEAFYRYVMASWLSRIYKDVREEQANSQGRSDIEVTTKSNGVIVFELKLIADCDNDDLDYASEQSFALIKEQVLEPAQVQLLDRGYGVNSHNTGKPVTGVIIAISRRERRIVAWRKYSQADGLSEGWIPAINMQNKVVTVGTALVKGKSKRNGTGAAKSKSAGSKVRPSNRALLKAKSSQARSSKR